MHNECNLDHELARVLQRQMETEAGTALHSSSEPLESMTQQLARNIDQEEMDNALAISLQHQETTAATRIEQEARDEELALRLQDSDQVSAPSNAGRKKWTIGRILSYVVMVPVVVLGTLTIVHYGGDFFENGDIPIPTLSDIFINGGTYDPGTIYPWKSDGHGLELTLVNALTAEWHEFFKQAVTEWDSGSPDSLTLSTTMDNPDSSCEPIQGKMKVCNGNYGFTDWKGINELVYRNGFITHSVAKMNDDYMRDTGKGEKQYLACHEIGHGFGLPHSDENFYNEDLGTCMDYTNRPEKNQSPNQDNYNLLYEMYGQVSKQRKKSNKRYRKRNKVLDDPNPSRRLEEIGYISYNKSHNDSKWKLIREHNNGETYIRNLAYGYRMQVHVTR